MLKQVDWVFFDVGNVIISDDPAVAFYYHELADAIREGADPSFTYARLLEAREALVASGCSAPGAELMKRYLSPEQRARFDQAHNARLIARYDALTPEIPGIRRVLDAIDGRARLGLIANQPEECARSLQRRGLWKKFSVHGISDVVRLAKPDPAFFQWALRESGARPERSVMIGDRVDNDMAPAKALGMTTMWMHWRRTEDKGIPADDEYLRRYMESYDRVSLGSVAKQCGAGPVDREAHSMQELERALVTLVEGRD